MATHQPTTSEDLILSEATDWFVQLAVGKIGSDHPPLIEWINRSPEHEAAFRACARTAHLGRAMRARSSMPDRRAVLTAGLAFVGLGAYSIMKPPLDLWPSAAEMMVDHRTGPGERYAFNPAPHIDIELNSRSSVSLSDRGRGLSLVSGEIFVDVERSDAPFRLHLGKTVLATTGATLNLQFIDKATRITCLSGQGECLPANQRSIPLTAGKSLRIDRNGNLTTQMADIKREVAWRENLLIFEQTPLSDAIAQINRYRSTPIILTNSALARRPVSAVLHTEQIGNATAQIQQLLNLKVQYLPGGVILMS